jgi:SOS-response transcriptional repressor LexA
MKPARKQRPLTKRQQQVLGFMREFFMSNDQIPPVYLIQEAFGFASATAATGHVAALARKGFIEKNAVGKWKFTRSQEGVNHEL